MRLIYGPLSSLPWEKYFMFAHFSPLELICTQSKEDIKGTVSRDFVICFLVSFDRSDVSTHKERVHLLLKFRFRVEFFDFCIWALWAPDSKMARKFVLVRGSYTRYFVIVYVYYYWGSCQEKWRKILIMYRRAPDSSMEPRTIGQCPSSMLLRQTSICMSAVIGS
jgi:hypothetical protein